jgi:hypothetical protein
MLRINLCVCVCVCLCVFLFVPQNKQRVLPYIALTVRILIREELCLLCGTN